MLVVVVLLATVLMRVVIVTAVVYLLLPQGSLCPHCNVEMVAVRNRVLDRLVPVLQRRWCLECGLKGVVPRVRRPCGTTPQLPCAPLPTPPEPGTPVPPAAGPPAAAAQTLCRKLRAAQ